MPVADLEKTFVGAPMSAIVSVMTGIPVRHTVTVAPDGFNWQGTIYPSLTAIARAITGTAWSGPRFFALRLNGKPTHSNGGKSARAADASVIEADASRYHGARRDRLVAAGTVVEDFAGGQIYHI